MNAEVLGRRKILWDRAVGALAWTFVGIQAMIFMFVALYMCDKHLDIMLRILLMMPGLVGVGLVTTVYSVQYVKLRESARRVHQTIQNSLEATYMIESYNTQNTWELFEYRYSISRLNLFNGLVMPLLKLLVLLAWFSTWVVMEKIQGRHWNMMCSPWLWACVMGTAWCWAALDFVFALSVVREQLFCGTWEWAAPMRRFICCLGRRRRESTASNSSLMEQQFVDDVICIEGETDENEDDEKIFGLKNEQLDADSADSPEPEKYKRKNPSRRASSGMNDLIVEVPRRMPDTPRTDPATTTATATPGEPVAVTVKSGKRINRELLNTNDW